MALNPFREALGQAGLRAFHHESSFKPEVDAALARFRADRDDLERRVRRGDLTVKVARQQAGAAADALRVGLAGQADGYSPVPRVFLDRLVAASEARKRSQERLPAEGLQRETNRLLRLNLVEQQLQTRAGEFEGRTAVRSFAGGQSAPTLASLLDFHETAGRAGDEAAREWGRRQLEAMRPRVTEPADLRKIDLACDRPEAVNPRLVASYMEALGGEGPEGLGAFAAGALEGRDANACVAAFLLARGAEGGPSQRWVRGLLDGLAEFPDAALATLRALEAEARAEDAGAARAQVDYATALAAAQAGLPGLEPPTDEELARRARVQAKPVARPGQPIGLALDRRGADPEEFAAAADLGP